MTSSAPSSAGTDLGQLWRGVVKAWSEMPSWPFFAWLGSESAVLLLHADGTQNNWVTDGVTFRASPQSKASAPFVALQLPEDLFLKRSVSLPGMADSDLRDALRLNVFSTSPFPADDLVWGYSSQTLPDGQREVSLITASRRQIDAFIAKNIDRFASQTMPMVWVVDLAESVIALTGFGEDMVHRLTLRKRWLAWGLLVLSGIFVAAIAVTPSAQLRFKAIDANRAYLQLGGQTAELTRKRGQLQDLTDKINAIKVVTADAVDVTRLMSRVTEVLPDDTNLVSLSVQGRKVSLYGQTPNAAALMQLLSTQEDFLEVKSPIAAIRPSGGTKDTFTIDFVLAPGVLTVVRTVAKIPETVSVTSAPKGLPAPVASTSSSPLPTASLPQQVASVPKGGKP